MECWLPPVALVHGVPLASTARTSLLWLQEPVRLPTERLNNTSEAQNKFIVSQELHNKMLRDEVAVPLRVC